MIDKRVYELDYIRELQKKYVSDPGLIERALYAFGLLEAIKSVGMPFCFKGGTSLMLILEKPARLSTDIDILVEPETDVDDYIDKASRIFPFLNKEEDIRKGKNGILPQQGRRCPQRQKRDRKEAFQIHLLFSCEKYGILYPFGCGVLPSSLCTDRAERDP